jgi:hypothetical protein
MCLSGGKEFSLLPWPNVCAASRNRPRALANFPLRPVPAADELHRYVDLIWRELGWPPDMTPRRFAAGIPAMVRCRVNSRSNSAKAAKTRKSAFPLAASCRLRALRPSAPSGRRPTLHLLHQPDQVERRAAQPVKLPSHQHVTGRAAGERISKPLAAVIRAGTDILKNRPCPVQRVKLHGKVLFVGRDTGIANQPPICRYRAR